MPRPLDIVVLAYDCVDVTWRCLVHLLAFAPKDARIVLFDNGSKDGTPKIGHWLSETGRGRYLRSDINLGIFSAWNSALRALDDDPPHYVAFLNNDICVSDRTFPALFDVANLGFFIVSARQYGNHSDPVMDPVPMTLPPGEKAPASYIEDYMFSAVMFRWTLFEQIGRFDDNFLMEYGDTDFALRAFRAGFTPVLATQAVVYHGGSVTRKRKHTLTSDVDYSVADAQTYRRKYAGDPLALRHSLTNSREKLLEYRAKEWSDGEQVTTHQP